MSFWACKTAQQHCEQVVLDLVAKLSPCWCATEHLKTGEVAVASKGLIGDGAHSPWSAWHMCPPAICTGLAQRLGLSRCCTH